MKTPFEYIQYHLDDFESYMLRGSKYWSPSKWVTIMAQDGIIEFSSDKSFEYWRKQIMKDRSRAKVRI